LGVLGLYVLAFFASSCFSKIFEELPVGRFQKSRKTSFQLHKATTSIPRMKNIKSKTPRAI
jgi:hypothetical protein